MEKILAVMTKEKMYADRFCSYVNHRRQLLFTAVPFDNIADCREFSKAHPVALLLADREFFRGNRYQGREESIESVKAGRVLMLAETLPAAGTENLVAEGGPGAGNGGTIRKYQSAEGILRDIMDQCKGLELRQTSAAAGRPVRIIGVYSPVGRSGCSSFAMTLAKVAGRRRKTLYLNCSEFSGMRRLTGENYETSLSDAMYYMKQGLLTPQKIYSMVYRFGGIEYLPPVAFAEDHETLKGEDYVELITTVLKNTSYEVIVADMDSFSNVASEVMDICDVVYMPVLEDPMAEGKVEEFEEYLRTAGRTRLLEKVVRIKTPFVRNLPGTASYLDSLAYGPMGELVRELGEG